MYEVLFRIRYKECLNYILYLRHIQHIIIYFHRPDGLERVYFHATQTHT